MPITIGVFVMHGQVKPTSDEALPRFNRSFEYDGLGDNYARFLLEELLPEVETKTTSDGRAIRLSKNGNDRCIGGASSGAICAFTAAWFRPDAFQRVFSCVGTYVGLRGGNDYPTLIRKFEPKPIRIFLGDGSNDLNIYGGDWWMANQEMERALKFAGYEVEHAWGEGGHNTEHAAQIFPDAMRYLWKDWPAEVKRGAGSQKLQEILIPGEEWQLVDDAVRGRAITANADGSIFISVLYGDRAQVIQDGQLSADRVDVDRKAQAFGPDGRRYLLTKEEILAIDNKDQLSKLADEINARDFTVRHDGSMYVTSSASKPDKASAIWYVSPEGDKKIVDQADRGYWWGICLSPDQSLLYVADAFSSWVYSYQIQPDGTLAHRQLYYELHMPDVPATTLRTVGMQTDRDGRLYVATPLMGIQVCDQMGRVNCVIPPPSDAAVDVCFGGPNFDTLFVICDRGVYYRKVKTVGANAFQPPIKPAPPKL
jgi:predicted esterase